MTTETVLRFPYVPQLHVRLAHQHQICRTAPALWLGKGAASGGTSTWARSAPCPGMLVTVRPARVCPFGIEAANRALSEQQGLDLKAAAAVQSDPEEDVRL